MDKVLENGWYIVEDLPETQRSQRSSKGFCAVDKLKLFQIDDRFGTDDSHSEDEVNNDGKTSRCEKKNKEPARKRVR